MQILHYFRVAPARGPGLKGVRNLTRREIQGIGYQGYRFHKLSLKPGLKWAEKEPRFVKKGF